MNPPDEQMGQTKYSRKPAGKGLLMNKLDIIKEYPASIRIVLKQCNECNSPLVLQFRDYKKAFDSGDWETLWNILRHYGIPAEIVNPIKEIYEGTTCRIIYDGQLRESFDIKKGVRQGWLLSPFPFILTIDCPMKETTIEGRQCI